MIDGLVVLSFERSTLVVGSVGTVEVVLIATLHELRHRQAYLCCTRQLRSQERYWLRFE